MSRPLICPIDHAAMIQGEDGSWRCRQQSGHLFQIDEAAGAAAAPGAQHCASNMACPACGEEMIPVPGRPGAWRCICDHRHVFSVVTRTANTPPPPGGLITRSPLLDRAGQGVAPRYWLSHIGINHPLLPPPQSNAGDGSYCQPLGDIAPGGGSKSGKRKKPKRNPPQPELWGA